MTALPSDPSSHDRSSPRRGVPPDQNPDPPADGRDAPRAKVSRSRVRTALPAAVWFLLIMVLLSLPGESFPTMQFWKPDKLAHILLFGSQAVLLFVALSLPRPSMPWSIPPMRFAGLATVAFGILSEGYQAVFTNRAADFFDMIANAVGVGLFLLAIRKAGTARILAAARRVLRLPASDA